MAILRTKDIRSMNAQEIEEKMKALKMEIIKANVTAQKGKAKTKEIKRAIAKILTITKNNKEASKK